MWTSNIKSPAWILCCGLAFALPLAADELTFADHSSRLTGTILSIDEKGRLELASPLSPSPLLLKCDSIDKIEFSNSPVESEAPSSLIELANGDLLPATIENLDDRNLTVTSPATGRLEFSRNAVSSMQLGIHEQDPIYSGPNSLEEWTENDNEAKNWKFRNASLFSSGPATASKMLSLPEKFILRFTLKWQPKQIPNLQVFFADPLKAKGVPCDRYCLHFSGSGLEIRRELSNNKRPLVIAQLNRTPNQYPDRQLKVEIRVERNDARIQLLLNDELEWKGIDPKAPAPDGGGITLNSNVPSSSPQEIREIQVLALDDSRTRHKAEDRGNPKTDSLISREDDRLSGHLAAIQKTASGVVFRFKSDFQNDPLEIPAEDVSTLFFAAEQIMKSEGEDPRFTLMLNGGGSLRVTSCRFTESKVFASHQLLGQLEISRRDIVSMARTTSKKKPQTKP